MKVKKKFATSHDAFLQTFSHGITDLWKPHPEKLSFKLLLN